MDTSTDQDMRERLAFEGAREGLPTGYPRLPELPVARYTDPGLYQQEITGVLKKTWLFAGHVSELPKPGSYRVLDIPFAPVVLTRAKDGHIRALLNACRHRGAPVVRDVCGTAKKLVCQYHSWAYDLDGRLVHTPQPRDFDPSIRENHDLGTIRCEVQNGFVFINFDQDAPSLEESSAPLTTRYGDLASPDMMSVSKTSYDVGCNWKILVEAFIESYHVPTIHQKTAAPLIDVERSVMVIHPYGHSAMALGYSKSVISGDEDGEMNWTSSLPTMPDASGFYDHAQVTLLAFPNLIGPLHQAGYPVLTIWPTGIDRTRLDQDWYGPTADRAQVEADPEWQMRQAGFDILTREDINNCEPIQQSVEAATHDGVPLSYQERRIWHFHRTIDELIDTSRIPAHLLVSDQLADYVEA